jgi:hypothetical protein
MVMAGADVLRLIHVVATRSQVPSFERGENGRILHIAAPVLRRSADVGRRILTGLRFPESVVQEMESIVGLREAMFERAKQAINCWSMVGQRWGVVEDVRIMISRLAWAEMWRWNEHWGEAERPKLSRRRERV